MTAATGLAGVRPDGGDGFVEGLGSAAVPSLVFSSSLCPDLFLVAGFFFLPFSLPRFVSGCNVLVYPDV